MLLYDIQNIRDRDKRLEAINEWLELWYDAELIVKEIEEYNLSDCFMVEICEIAADFIDSKKVYTWKECVLELRQMANDAKRRMQERWKVANEKR